MSKIKKGIKFMFSTVLMLLTVFNVIAMASIPYIQLELTYDGELHYYNRGKVYLNINGEDISTENFPLEPIIIDDYTLVPAREVFEIVGAEVNWDQSTYSIEVIYEDITINMSINGLTATKDVVDEEQETLILDIPPKLINAKTMIPIRFVSEAIGFDVDWINDERLVVITDPRIVEDLEEEEGNLEEDLQEEDINNFVSLIGIDMPKEDEQVFIINADNTSNTSTGITKYEIVRLDDKKIGIDIYNSVNNIETSTFNSINKDVSSIDISEFSDNITRFTFNLVNSLDSILYYDYLTEDANKLYIIFGENQVETLETFSYEEEYEEEDLEEEDSAYEEISVIANDAANLDDELNAIITNDDDAIAIVDTETGINYIDVIKISTSTFPIFDIEYKSVANLTEESSSDEALAEDATYGVLTLNLLHTDVEKMTQILNPTIFIDSLMCVSMSENTEDNSIAKINFYLKDDITYGYELLEEENMIIIKIGDSNYKGFEDDVEDDEDITSGDSSNDDNSSDDDSSDDNSSDNSSSDNTSSESNSDNLFVPSQNQLIINKKGDTPVNLNNIVHDDNYLNLTYTLKFASDLSDLVSSGTHSLSSEYASSIEVSHMNTGTEIKINCKKITAIIITENESSIYINLVHPQEKYDHVVVVDAGHGGHDPGAVQNGINEKDVALDLILKLEKLLEPHTNIKAYFTRTTDVYPEFSERTDLSNEVADFFISIHYNSVTNTSASGSETYYHSTANNSNSSGLTSKTLAEIVQQSMLNELGTVNRGVKTANYIVLRDNTKPSILAEIEFLSNASQASKIKTEEFKISAANSIYNAIIQVTNTYTNIR